MTDLNFHPFQDGFSINSTNEQSGFGGGSIGDRDRNQLVDDADALSAGPKKNFFSFSFYQQYFDVDTDQVVKRVLNSVVPTHNNFILDFVQPLPDLWGPFWVSLTLVFSIGVFGNIAQYIENEGGSAEYGSDFRLVTSASTLIFCYIVIVPLALFAVLWQRKSDLQYPYLDLLCAYGYSLSIFIPVSLLWVLDVNWFRWALIFVAVSLSGGVLAKAIYPAFKNDPNKLVAFGSIAGVLLLHFLLAFTFKVYFFDAAHPPRQIVTPKDNLSQAASQVQDSIVSSPPALPANATTALPAKQDGTASKPPKDVTSSKESVQEKKATSAESGAKTPSDGQKTAPPKEKSEKPDVPKEAEKQAVVSNTTVSSNLTTNSTSSTIISSSTVLPKNEPVGSDNSTV